MLNAELWAQGGITMIIGMGIVFSFLTILVFAMLIMTKCISFINKFCPEATVEPKKTVTSDDSEIAAAIAVAYSKI